jgi:hypothetical protein
MLVGMYALLPLQNQVSLLSTTLSPQVTSQSYPVFAPTSHPIPVLAHSSSTSIASPLLSRLGLPRSFLLQDRESESRTVFLITENRCGLDGLRGKVVPGFANIWLEGKGAWGLYGVHPVRLVLSRADRHSISCPIMTLADTSIGDRLVPDACLPPCHPIVLVKSALIAGHDTRPIDRVRRHTRTRRHGPARRAHQGTQEEREVVVRACGRQ